MSFFEPPPPAPQPPEPPGVVRKPWWHAPRNELGVSTSVRLILARTENIAVALIDAVAYSMGIEFTLAVLRRLPREPDRFEHPFGRFGHGPRAGQELPPELLRFGVQFQDGRKATTVGSEAAMLSFGHSGEEEPEPEGPILSPGGGSGGADYYESSFWLWPLPPPGPLAFVVEWPAEGIELTRHEVDASVFIEAASRSEELWPEAPPAAGGRTSY